MQGYEKEFTNSSFVWNSDEVYSTDIRALLYLMRAIEADYTLKTRLIYWFES